MICREDLIEIGVYNKPHGINGEISATFDYDIDVISSYNCFISDVNGIFVPFFAENIRPKSNETVLLKIEGMDDEKSVKLLVNRKIYAMKSSFKEARDSFDENSDEISIDYFIGFNIHNDENEFIGKIIDVDCSTENYLFVVEHEDSDILIPATDDFITDIDFEQKILTMNLPKGILDI